MEVPALQQEPAATSIADVTPAVTVSRDVDESVWPDVLNKLKSQYNTLYGVLRMAKPVFSADGVELQCKFAFHQKRLNEIKNRQIVADFFKEVTGHEVVITCTVGSADSSAAKPGSHPAAQAKPAELGTISDIFGGGEVLHS